MQHQSSIDIEAPAATIYALYQDVARWNTWDPDTRSAWLDGPFGVGARGKLVPTRGRPVPLCITQATENRSFTARCAIPGFCMDFVHELTPLSTGTRVVQRLETSGFLGFLLNPVIGPQVREGFPKTLAALKQLAESQHAGDRVTR
ncbi:MAG: SRPBCC family protein [Rubrivivax sp.]|nr:SRPBCC family protein [Rubrivivax sp.]